MLPGQTVAKLFEALFVVLDALMFASVRSSFFDVVFYLLSEPLGVDVELPSRPSDPEKQRFSQVILTFLKNQRFRYNDGFENVLGLS